MRFRTLLAIAFSLASAATFADQQSVLTGDLGYVVAGAGVTNNYSVTEQGYFNGFDQSAYAPMGGFEHNNMFTTFSAYNSNYFMQGNGYSTVSGIVEGEASLAAPYGAEGAYAVSLALAEQAAYFTVLQSTRMTLTWTSVGDPISSRIGQLQLWGNSGGLLSAMHYDNGRLTLALDPGSYWIYADVNPDFYWYGIYGDLGSWQGSINFTLSTQNVSGVPGPTSWIPYAISLAVLARKRPGSSKLANTSGS